MRPRDSEINACNVDFDEYLAHKNFDYWYDRIETCLARGTHAGLVALYAQRKFYPALVSALSAIESECAAYDPPEYGDFESDYDTY